MKTEARESNRSLCNGPGEEINKDLSQSAAEIGMERRDEGEVHMSHTGFARPPTRAGGF